VGGSLPRAAPASRRDSRPARFQRGLGVKRPQRGVGQANLARRAGTRASSIRG
jgi:hypothetical protein